jgi:3-phytase
VTASAETEAVPHSGDAADDAAVWIHPTDPQLSVIVGTDKQGGLAVYDLSGVELSYHPDGDMNNVDLRYNFRLGGVPVAVVAASDRTHNSLALYTVHAGSRALVNVAARTISMSPEPYGLCMYRSAATAKYYVFTNDAGGVVRQWELFEAGAGRVDARMVRTFDVGGQTEGCVADDAAGTLYIGEEDVAIWKYGAEPTAGTARTRVDAAGGGRLVADIEGLTLYSTSGGGGYLLASSQGNDSFVVYERTGVNAYVTTFTIAAGSVDRVSETDGIEVTNFALGSRFSEGLFVAQDNTNTGGNQNFKLVSWGTIARSRAGSPLAIDPKWDPRAIGS